MNISVNNNTQGQYILNLTSGEKIGLALVIAVAFLMRIYQLDSQDAKVHL